MGLKMRLKILASAILILIVGYTVAWHYMAGEVEDRIEAWVSRQKSHGLSVRYDDLEISGFPYRMELSLSSLKVIKTGRGGQPILFTSPNITLVAFPWKINHGVIVSEGGSLRVGSRRRPILSMAFGKSRSSVLVDLASGKIRRASFVLEDVTWTTGPLPQKNVKDRKLSQAREVKLHIMRPQLSAETPDLPPGSDSDLVNDMELPVQMKLYLEAKDIIAMEIPAGIFGRKADHVKVDLQLHGIKMPDYSKDSLAFWRDNGGTLAVKNFAVRHGKMDLELDGEVTLDQDLKPLGAFSSRIHGISHIVDILSRHAAFQIEPGSVILDELNEMSKIEEHGVHKGQKALDLAISLQGGLLFLGPIPVYELKPVVE